MSKTALVIPDGHAKHGVSNRRFDWLGQAIVDRKPDYIIDIGDFADLPQLYGISKRKITATEQLMKEVDYELQAVRDAIQRTYYPLYLLQQHQRHSKRKIYSPKKIRTLGNHCDRFRLLMEHNPEYFEDHRLDSYSIPYDGEGSLFYDRFQVNNVPFQELVEVEGIVFCHNYVNGTSGISTADGLLKHTHQSAVTGHTHKAEWKPDHSAFGKPVYGLQCGCFLDPDDNGTDYAPDQAIKNWWTGIVILHGLDGSGYYEPEFIGARRLKELYDVDI